jgi:hypothetical protein
MRVFNRWLNFISLAKADRKSAVWKDKMLKKVESRFKNDAIIVKTRVYYSYIILRLCILPSSVYSVIKNFVSYYKITARSTICRYTLLSLAFDIITYKIIACGAC